MNKLNIDKLLIIDDDEIFRTRLAKAFKDRGLSVIDIGCAIDGIETAKLQKPSHIILDLKMPKKSGTETLKEILSILPNSKVVILTGYGSITTALETTKSGAINYLSKPTDIDTILASFSGQVVPNKDKSKVPSLDKVEWEHIQRVLSDCNGNISKAAKMLGLHRRSLQRKLSSPPL